MSTENTDKLKLPYIMAGQAQKHITHNKALQRLDALVQLSVLARDLTSPPAAPAAGDCYIVAPGATGAWSGKEGHVAAYLDGAWLDLMPGTGWRAWVEAESTNVVWDGAAWNEIVPARAEKFGINVLADDTNRLAVKSDAALFSHDDVTPGSGDMRLALNKAAASSIVSMLFETNWSGRAEVGLAGDDDWRVKVSSDGAAWVEALKIDRQSGVVAMPATPSLDGYANWIINGDFSINQRQGSRNPGIGVYGYDRWKGHADGLEQVVEDLPTGEYTLFWAGGGQGTFAGTTGVSPIKGTTTAGNVPVVVPSGATSVCLLAGDKSAAANPFVARPEAVELQLCQRYYEKSYNLDVAPGTATQIGRVLVPYTTGSASSVQRHTIRYQRKRTVPTVTLYDVDNGTVGKVALSTGSQVYAGLYVIGETACLMDFHTAEGSWGGFQYVIDAEL